MFIGCCHFFENFKLNKQPLIIKLKIKAMKRSILLSVLMIVFAFATINSASAQEVKNLFKDKVKVARGTNPDLKDKAACEMPDVEKPNPTQTRGSWCTIQFDNWTGYYINIWVDGYYQGQLAPWSEGYVDVIAGWTKVYCETSGGTYYWSSEGSCSGTHYFKLQ
jgi:hypothetical protein